MEKTVFLLTAPPALAWASGADKLIAVLYYGMFGLLGTGLGGYFAVPASVLLARRSYLLAGLASTFAWVAPITLLGLRALRFDRPHNAPAAPLPTGLICWILAGALLTIVWTFAAWRERDRSTLRHMPAGRARFTTLVGVLVFVCAVPACSPDKCFDGPSISVSGGDGFSEQAQALCQSKGLYLHWANGGAGRLEKVCCYR